MKELVTRCIYCGTKDSHTMLQCLKRVKYKLDCCEEYIKNSDKEIEALRNDTEIIYNLTMKHR
jgi:hypothetical protein